MPFKIDSNLQLGYVHLRVLNLQTMRSFYKKLGLEISSEEEKKIAFSIPGNHEPILILSTDDNIIPRPPRTTGLFHLAILVNSREDLAHVIGNISREGIPITGAGDHIYSEAFYLNDPEGNGIEIYRDRPRDEWIEDDKGGLVTATNPVDIQGVMALFYQALPWNGFPNNTILGHVHLNVSQLDEQTTYFYLDALGLDIMTNFMDSALFISAGGYHHHIAVNIWQGTGVPNSPKLSSGLVAYSLQLSSQEELQKLADNLVSFEIPFTFEGNQLIVYDFNEDSMIFTTK